MTVDTPVAHPVTFFRELGLLHDAQLNAFSWDGTRQQISLVIGDYKAGIAEDDEPDKSAIFCFEDAAEMGGTLSSFDWGISEFEVMEASNRFSAQLTLKSGAIFRWVFKSATATF